MMARSDVHGANHQLAHVLAVFGRDPHISTTVIVLDKAIGFIHVSQDVVFHNNITHFMEAKGGYKLITHSNELFRLAGQAQRGCMVLFVPRMVQRKRGLNRSINVVSGVDAPITHKLRFTAVSDTTTTALAT